MSDLAYNLCLRLEASVEQAEAALSRVSQERDVLAAQVKELTPATDVADAPVVAEGT